MSLVSQCRHHAAIPLAALWIACAAVAQEKKLEITMIFQTEEGFCFFNPLMATKIPPPVATSNSPTPLAA